MNLNKYTKAELISRFKKLESKIETNQNSLIKNYFNQIWELALTFKSLLLKLTFISFITKIFLKYKLFRKLWVIFNTIVMTIFGFSLLENSLFDFFSNIFIEVRFILANVIDYLSETQFFKYLSKLYSRNEVIEPVTQAKIKDSINNRTGDWVTKSKSIESLSTENNSNNRWNIENSEIKNKSKIGEWLKPEAKVIEDIQTNEFNYTKYLAILALGVVTASLCWYYSDEIRTGAMSVYDWINTFRPGGGTNGGDNNPGINNATVVDPNQPIELIDNTKGKSKVLSPSQSMEDLNTQAKLTWGDFTKAPDSPNSTDSNLTITQESIKVNPDTTIASSSKLTLDTSTSIPTSDRPGSALGENTANFLAKWIQRNWRNRLNNDIKSKIAFIENNVNSDSLSADDQFNLTKYYYDIIRNYNEDLALTINMKDTFTEDSALMLDSIYYLREWIVEHKDKVLPNSIENIELKGIVQAQESIQTNIL
jgi:hypothetical protein